MNELGIVIYKYYCKNCASNHSYRLTFKQWRDEDYACPKCKNKLKFVTSNDIRDFISNVGYCSAEKISAQNIKRIGNEQYQMMCENDPVVQKRIEQRDSPKPWYQNTDEPLDLKTVKDVEKYITTGDKS